MYQVPDDLQSQLLIPMLNTRATSLIVRMPAADMGKYSKIKSFLLSEFKLTPQEYKSRFDNAAKVSDETWVLFAARLRNLLLY